MPNVNAAPPAGSAALRGAGTMIRAAQTIGFEWLDLGRQQHDDFSATAARIAASRDPREALLLQGAFVQRATERVLSRSLVVGNIAASLVGRLLSASDAGGRRTP